MHEAGGFIQGLSDGERIKILYLGGRVYHNMVQTITNIIIGIHYKTIHSSNYYKYNYRNFDSISVDTFRLCSLVQCQYNIRYKDEL